MRMKDDDRLCVLVRARACVCVCVCVRVTVNIWSFFLYKYDACPFISTRHQVSGHACVHPWLVADVQIHDSMYNM